MNGKTTRTANHSLTLYLQRETRETKEERIIEQDSQQQQIVHNKTHTRH